MLILVASFGFLQWHWDSHSQTPHFGATWHSGVKKIKGLWYSFVLYLGLACL
jgi:hypothetical protein